MLEKPKQLALQAHGPGEVCARHITTDADIEILNPDLHIATLNKDATLDIVMDVQLGRGMFRLSDMLAISLIHSSSLSMRFSHPFGRSRSSGKHTSRTSDRL